MSDDIPLARYVHPALTTMRVDIASLGERAMDMLQRRIAGGAPAGPQPPIAPELIVRDTTAPPPN